MGFTTALPIEYWQMEGVNGYQYSILLDSPELIIHSPFLLLLFGLFARHLIPMRFDCVCGQISTTLPFNKVFSIVYFIEFVFVL